MKTVSGHKFLQWAAGVGIGFDSRYPDSGCLTFLPTREYARFWILPPDPAAWPHFLTSLLNGLDEWAMGYLWPRSRCWPKSAQSQSDIDGVRDVVLRGAGIPDGWDGAIQFERDDQNALLAVLFVYSAFGWCVDDDLFFVPEHARQLLQTDHHDVIHIECTEEARILDFVRNMEQEGYLLPTEPPDATFIWPPWMPAP